MRPHAFALAALLGLLLGAAVHVEPEPEPPTVLELWWDGRDECWQVWP